MPKPPLGESIGAVPVGGAAAGSNGGSINPTQQSATNARAFHWLKPSRRHVVSSSSADAARAVDRTDFVFTGIPFTLHERTSFISCVVMQ